MMSQQKKEHKKGACLDGDEQLLAVRLPVDDRDGGHALEGARKGEAAEDANVALEALLGRRNLL